MTTTHLIRGHVPTDSPLRRLAGRTVTLPAGDLPELAERVREMRRAGIQPVVMAAPRYVPWTPIALGLAGAVIGALVAAISAILAHEPIAASAAGGAMVLLGVALFPVLTHLEMDA